MKKVVLFLMLIAVLLPALILRPLTESAEGDPGTAPEQTPPSDGRSMTLPRNADPSASGGTLTDGQRALKKGLKSAVQAVAWGERDSTQIELSLSDLGIPYADARAADMEKVLGALLLECTYELYWFGRQVSWSFPSEDRMQVNLYVSAEYAADDSRLRVQPQAIQEALEAVARADDIIEAHADLSDVEKLRAYRDEICRLTAYNRTAAYTDVFADQEGPWSLVWVFDGDPVTNVVCEGYAKAFEYLCSRSTFRSEGIRCRCASGPAVFPDGASGPHMWNIVTMDDGKNYVIDVTRSDEGDAGSDLFFLCYALEGAPQQGYRLSNQAQYAYDSVTLAAYPDEDLALAAAPYGG